MKLSVSLLSVVGACVLAVAPIGVLAQDRASKDDAVAMVAKGIAAIKAKGADAAYVEMTAPNKTL